MRVEELRWYQWLLVGACVGAVLGWVHVAATLDTEDTLSRTIGQEDFEAALLEPMSGSQPVLQDVVVHPKGAKNVYWITGLCRTQVRLHADGTDPYSPMVDAEVTTPFKFPAPAIYRPFWGLDAKSGLVHLLSAADRQHALPTTPFAFLDRTHQLRPATAPVYGYAWFDPPFIRWAAWTAGSAAVIGGIWPPIVGLLLGAGLGRKQPEDLLDLTRFARGGEDPKLKPAMEGLVFDDEEVADDHGVNAHTSGDSREGESTAAIATLIPDPPPAPPGEQPSEPKSYEGEFYPTVIHGPR